MNVLFTQISGLTGLFVFLNQMWRYASLEKSMFTAILVGLGVYVVLVLGDLSIRMILHYYPSKATGAARTREASEELNKASKSSTDAQSRPLSA